MKFLILIFHQNWKAKKWIDACGSSGNKPVVWINQHKIRIRVNQLHQEVACFMTCLVHMTLHHSQATVHHVHSIVYNTVASIV